jgi:hypothetical protein
LLEALDQFPQSPLSLPIAPSSFFEFFWLFSPCAFLNRRRSMALRSVVGAHCDVTEFFLLLVAVSAALAYLIAGSGNHTLTSVLAETHGGVIPAVQCRKR